MHQFTSRQSRYSPDMSWQLPSSEERTMCERSKCNLDWSHSQREGRKLKSNLDLDRRKVAKVQYSKLKVIKSKSQLAKGEKGNKIIFGPQKKESRAGAAKVKRCLKRKSYLATHQVSFHRSKKLLYGIS